MSTAGGFLLGLCIGVVLGAWFVLDQLWRDLEQLMRWEERRGRR